MPLDMVFHKEPFVQCRTAPVRSQFIFDSHSPSILPYNVCSALMSICLRLWDFIWDDVSISEWIRQCQTIFEHLWGPFLYIYEGRAKLGSQLGSHKLSNIYVSSSEVVWEWMVVPLRSNGQKTSCARRDHCLIWHYQIW